MKQSETNRCALSRRTLLEAWGVGLIAAAVPGFALGQDDVHAMLGTFDFSGGDKERQALDAAIEVIVGEMTPIARPIARDKLRKGCTISSAIIASSADKTLTIRLDDGTYTAPLDGTAVKVKMAFGEEMALSYRVGAGAITQQFTGDEKGRTNEVSRRRQVVHDERARLCEQASEGSHLSPHVYEAMRARCGSPRSSVQEP